MDVLSVQPLVHSPPSPSLSLSCLLSGTRFNGAAARALQVFIRAPALELKAIPSRKIVRVRRRDGCNESGNRSLASLNSAPFFPSFIFLHLDRSRPNLRALLIFASDPTNPRILLRIFINEVGQRVSSYHCVERSMPNFISVRISMQIALTSRLFLGAPFASRGIGMSNAMDSSKPTAFLGPF